jgi:hypothetical protein
MYPADEEFSASRNNAIFPVGRRANLSNEGESTAARVHTQLSMSMQSSLLVE